MKWSTKGRGKSSRNSGEEGGPTKEKKEKRDIEEVISKELIDQERRGCVMNLVV